MVLILSENDDDVVCFSVPPAIIVLSVGDLLVAAISVEMSDSSDISSRSNVPVVVAKLWPCSTGVDSLASLLPLPSSPCTSSLSFMAWSVLTSTSMSCDIRPEWPKCNLCRIRIFSSEPSGLVVITN